MLEGASCVGKGTQLELLQENLEKRGLSVVTTREPGGTQEAEEIRKEIFRLRMAERLAPEEELKMMYKARSSNMWWVREQLEQGKTVLKDRDYMSSWFFQAESGCGRQLLNKIHQEQYIDNGFGEPDLRIVLYLGKEELWRRLSSRGDEGDSFDVDVDFVGRVAERYGEAALDMVRGYGVWWKNTIIIGAERSREVVAGEILREVERRVLKEDREGDQLFPEGTLESVLRGRERR